MGGKLRVPPSKIRLITGASDKNLYIAYKSITEADFEFNIELNGDGNTGQKIITILAVQ